MADRVPSDHSSVTSVRATLSSVGRTDRPAVDIPADAADSFPTGEVVRLTLDGTEYRTLVETPLVADGVVLRGAYDTADDARSDDPDGPNRLAEWVDDHDRSFESSVIVDVVEPDFKYGLREPGKRVVYRATEAPDESLASIAQSLESDDEP